MAALRRARAGSRRANFAVMATFEDLENAPHVGATSGYWSTALPRSVRLLALVCAVTICCSAHFARADDLGPPVPDPQDLIGLVRDTVLAVDAGNKSGGYDVLFGMGSPAFQSANPPDRLAESFSRLRRHNLDLAPVKNMTPLTTGAPTLDRNGLLRILGFFELAGRQIVYDLVYEYDGKARRWRVAGVSLTPRNLPQTPELMQPN
jgi:hypothetical protein